MVPLDDTPSWYGVARMAGRTELTYTVSDMSCGHCERAITDALSTLPGVDEVVVDLNTKRVVVTGDELADADARAAIADAGYEAA